MGFGAKEWHGENCLFMKSVLYMENTLRQGGQTEGLGTGEDALYDVNLVRGGLKG